MKDQLRFDLSQLTVAPGQARRDRAVESDGMLHNFVLGAPGSLEAIGALLTK